MQSNDSFNAAILWRLIFDGVAVFGLVFFACEIGQRLTSAFDEIVYEFSQFDWDLFPLKIKRMLPTLMIGVQRPMVIGCFETFFASREQFKKVHSSTKF